MHKCGISPIYCLRASKEKFLEGTIPLDKAILATNELRNGVIAALRVLQIPGILRYSPSLCLTHAPFSYQARRNSKMSIKDTYNEYG